jgi:hypothetical protein
MGLDMYLHAKKYISKIDWAATQAGDDYVVREQFNDIIKTAGLDNVPDNNVAGAEVSVTCAYWRKANQIHGWFVDNVQGGEDNCEEHYVSREMLTELLNTCKEALAKRDPSLIQPREGCFFGGYDIDQYYWGDLQETITMLEKVLKLDDDLSFYYVSSW